MTTPDPNTARSRRMDAAMRKAYELLGETDAEKMRPFIEMNGAAWDDGVREGLGTAAQMCDAVLMGLKLTEPQRSIVLELAGAMRAAQATVFAETKDYFGRSGV